jgi:hypothetical protein
MSVQRPRYQGAEDIGSWQSVLSFISWVALPINVLILVFTSWDFRNYMMIPWVANFETTCASAYDVGFGNATASSYLPAAAFISAKAAFFGQDTTYLSKCEPNIVDCYANIGQEEWLSATTYLHPNMTTTTKYINALCDADFPAPMDGTTPSLYNELHCNTCRNWMNDVWRWQLFAALVIEHLLLLVKMLIAALVPDQPGWVVEANARKQFMLQMKDTKQRRKTSIAIVTPEMRNKAVMDIVAGISTSDDIDDAKGVIFSAKV